MVSKPMRSAAKATEKAAARMNAAASDSSQAHAADDTSSAAHSLQPAATVAASARGESPRAYDGSPSELIYSGESDGASDLRKTVGLPESLAAANYKPSSKKARSNSKTHGSYHSRFESEHEEIVSSSAPASTHSPVHEYDNGPSRREGSYRGTISSVDSRTSERATSFAASSRHGRSRYTPRGSVGHRASLPAAAVEEGKLALVRFPELDSEVAQHDCVLHEFGDEVDHERGVRRSLEKMVQRLRIDRSDDRSESTISQLENDRGRQAFRDGLSPARRDIVSLQTQLGNLVRDHKNLLGIFERNGCIRPQKKPRADSRGRSRPT
ncbi:unnamed protein product [Peronospora destructor]|uniref:Cep57 centrosome microtubule-binding domain-containing protein n=1 Tax=Peronospora destructor TaxID=86335 RepID=A0AAV0TUD3_9STRA|nr:unnamed protein product [Peronospora destructor]